MDRIIQMFLNKLLSRFMNTAINKGVDYAARRGKAPGQMTDADHEQARQAKDALKRARQAAKLARRIK